MSSFRFVAHGFVVRISLLVLFTIVLMGMIALGVMFLFYLQKLQKIDERYQQVNQQPKKEA